VTALISARLSAIVPGPLQLLILIIPLHAAVPLFFGISSGGSVDVSLQLEFCLLSMKAKVVVTPGVAINVGAKLGVSLVLFEAGIEITGVVLDLKFPLTATIDFKKFPLGMTLSMDMVLIPIQFILEGFCEEAFAGTTIVRGVIWKYSAKPITSNIFQLGKDPNQGKDSNPPSFGGSAKSRRDLFDFGESLDGCQFFQVPGRDHTDAAFSLSFSVEDDESNFDVFYQIGTQAGSDDVVPRTKVRGETIIEAMQLPQRRKYYAQVMAEQSNGQSSSIHCNLDMWDTTLPGGGWDVADKTSNPRIIRGFLRAEDTYRPLLEELQIGVGTSVSATAGDGVVPLGNFDVSITAGHTTAYYRERHFDFEVDLSHASVYYFNAHATNELGYVGLVSSAGTLVDLTPPEIEGLNGSILTETLTADGCNISTEGVAPCTLADDPTPIVNHRTVSTDLTSEVLFTGQQPGVHWLFSSNRYVQAANWQGFSDAETGLSGYEYFVGSTASGRDLWNHQRAKGHFLETEGQLHSDKGLDEGPLYWTVTAFNTVQHGGAMASTVHHHAPLVVDYTKPVVEKFHGLNYTDNTVVLTVVANDRWSGIGELRIGIGSTKYNTLLLPYVLCSVAHSEHIREEHPTRSDCLHRL